MNLMNSEFETDGSRYVSRKEYAKEIQIPEMIRILNVSKEFAEKLYNSWIRINYRYFDDKTRESFVEQSNTLGSTPYNAILLDTWLFRGINWPRTLENEDTYDSLIEPIAPYGTRESQWIQSRQHWLLEISESKQVLTDSEIPIWHPKNKNQLLSLIENIKSRLKFSENPNYQLWFRGQNKEYVVERDPEVISWLKYPNSASQSISLLPNLARIVLEDFKVLEKFIPFGGIASRYWQRAYLISVFKHNSSWFDEKPGYLKFVEDSLIENDHEKINKIFYDIRNDPLIADEADDFRQWWFAFYNSTTLTLILQHYGLPTSGLDITKNIDLALFFALNRYDQNEFYYKKYQLNTKNPPVIYFFLSNTEYGYGDTNIISSEEFFKSSDDIKFPTPLRIQRQECGLLWGNHYVGANYFSELILGKIVLDEFEHEDTTHLQQHYFPGSNSDEIYKILENTKPEIPYFMRYENNSNNQ